MFKNERGFTITELLVAMIIISILATIVIVNFVGVQVRARDSERKSDIETLSSFLETEFQKNGRYPSVTTMTGSVSDVQAVLKGIPANVLATPGQPTGTNSLSAFYQAPNKYNPTISQYAYWTSSSNQCTTSYTVMECGTFVLVYRKEADDSLEAICGRGANVNNTRDIFPGPNGLPSFDDSECSNF